MKIKKTKRFVLDTNVVISLIIAEKLNLLVELKKKNRLEYYSCICHINEIKKNILKLYKRGIIDNPFVYIDNITSVFIINNITHSFRQSPDNKDNFLYDIAIQFSATLVTREKALLSFEDSPIQTLDLETFKTLF